MINSDKDKSKYNPALYTRAARRDRFRRVAELRTNRILNDLRLLGNTANRTLYDYDRGDIEKIFTTIDKKMTETRGKFKTASKERPFTLD